MIMGGRSRIWGRKTHENQGHGGGVSLRTSCFWQYLEAALGYERWPRPRRPHRRALWRRPCRQSGRLEFLSQRSLAAGCALPVRAEGCHHEKLPKHTHAASTYGIAPARRARPWILYGTSEQSRWAPQLGQRSWHACMSIIMCPHMGHSFLLPAAIHYAQGSASYYSFWQTRRLRPSGLCAPAPGSPSVCLDRRRALPPRLREAAELKFLPSSNPYRFSTCSMSSTSGMVGGVTIHRTQPIR